MTNRETGEIDARLGRRIRALRLEVGLSQERMAELSGVTFQQVQKYESGKNRISVSRLCRIAEALSVLPSYLLDDLGAIGGDAIGFEDQLATPEGAQLMRAFRQITRTKIRRQVVALVRAVGEQT